MPSRIAAGKRLEYVWIGPPPDDAPTLVFLHEGLGSITGWHDFPEALAAATRCGALVYDRWGHGRSEPLDRPRPVDFMHREARESLPELLGGLGVGRPILVGQSDGASIALIYAGSRPSPRDGPAPLALLLEAPHVFVEELTVRSIERARAAFEAGPLRERLARHHGPNTEPVFRGWNDVWLDPAFRSWNLEPFLPAVACPVLAIQGLDDEYGTPAQVEAIRRGTAGRAQLELWPDCGHAPHRRQPARTLERMARFVEETVAGLRAR